ncbi:lipase [Williamsia sp. 1135]|nr:lipase [Williamsia sp. 1135]
MRSSSSRLLSGGLLAALLLGLIALIPPAAHGAPAPNEAPAGANDWSCRPGEAHPRPVVLVHGTWADMATTWKSLSPALKEQGYCVFALNYGTSDPQTGQNLLDLVGGNSIERSAATLAEFVSKVKSATGAGQVDIVGHSQGALVSRQYLKFNGGTNTANPARNQVNTLVSLAGTNHGTTFNFNQEIGAIAQLLGVPVVKLAATTVGPSYVQQMVGSHFLTKLNAGGDTMPSVDYVAIGTKNDLMVTPPERTFLKAGPGATVQNVWVQDGCSAAVVDHGAVTSSPRSVWLTLNALDPAYGAAHEAPCP